jgi:hypothetical protein
MHHAIAVPSKIVAIRMREFRIAAASRLLNCESEVS